MSALPEPDDDTPMDFTGERFTPECEREIVYEHWHRYGWARRLAEGRNVLDCACGEGYGSALLADAATRVTGVDVDGDAIEHARRRYARSNLEFIRADALDLPFEDATFDLVVSFETLEHLAEHDALLTEFRRVLRPDGVLLLSSPDKRTYSDLTGYDNEFHVRELYRDELEALLQRHFPNYRLSGQKLMFHSLVWSLDDAASSPELLTDGEQGLRASDRPMPEPLYFLAAASADGVTLPALPALSLYTDERESVYAHYNDVVRKHIRAEQRVAECEQEIERLKASMPPARVSLWKRLRRWLTNDR